MPARRLASASDSDVLAVRVRDRFCDSGIVGVAILRHGDARSTIDTLLLSCRVLARGIEDVVLAACAARSRARGSHELIGMFAPTARNGQVSRFYQDRGFETVGEDRFRRSLMDEEHFVTPPHIKRITIDGEQAR